MKKTRTPYYTRRQHEILLELQRKHAGDSDWTERDKKLTRYNRIRNRDRKRRTLAINQK